MDAASNDTGMSSVATAEAARLIDVATDKKDRNSRRCELLVVDSSLP